MLYMTTTERKSQEPLSPQELGRLSHEKILLLKINLRSNNAYVLAAVGAFLGDDQDADLGSSSGSTISNISFRQGDFEYRLTYKSESDKGKRERTVSYDIDKYLTAGPAKPKPEESFDLEYVGKVSLSSKYKIKNNGEKDFIDGNVEVDELKDSNETYQMIHSFIGEIFPTPLGV